MTEGGKPSLNKPCNERFRKLEIYPGYACSRSCRFCFVSRRDREKYRDPLPFRTVCETIYKSYHQEGSRTIAVLGGEPTLYRDLPAVLSFANRVGYVGSLLFTNGFRFAEPGYAEKMAELKLNAVQINLPSHEPETFDYLTRSENGLERAVKALENLRRANIVTTAVCVLTRQNCDSLADYAAFYRSLGVRFFMVHYTKFLGNLDPDEKENTENIRSITVPMSTAAEGVFRMTDYCVAEGIVPPFVEIIPPCIMGKYASRVIDFIQDTDDAGSETLIQPGFDFSKTYDVSYRGRVRLPCCTGCIWGSRCCGVEANYVKLFGYSEFKAVTEEPEPYYSVIPENERRDLFRTLPDLTQEAYLTGHGESLDGLV